MKAKNYEDAVVATGFLRVDPDGSIWRVTRKKWVGHSHWGAMRTVSLDPPERMDKRISQGGYRLVRFDVGGSRNIFAHRIVWRALVGRIPDGMQINHKNGVKTDNRIENLEVVTPQQNCHHAIRVLGAGTSKLSTDDVVKIRGRRAAGESPRALGAAFGVSHKTIQAVVSGAHWRTESGARTKPGLQRGEANHKAKLTAEGVLEVRRRAADGESAAAIARDLGMDRSSIADAVRRKTWAHLPVPVSS